MATLLRGPYLQSTSKTNLTIKWYTTTACDSKVQIGTTTSFGTTFTDSTSTTEHSIRISGLLPNTKYYYFIGTTTQILDSDPTKNFFYTTPTTDSNQPIRFWVLADMGVNTSNQKAVKDKFLDYNGSNKVDFWFWIGDNAYNSGTYGEFDSNTFGGTNGYSTELKKYNLFSVTGNHDYANVGSYLSGGWPTAAAGTSQPYFNLSKNPSTTECGGVASFTEKYYSVDYGNVHIIVMDGYGADLRVGSDQYNWLINDLENNSKKWVILFEHFPAFTHGTHNSDTEAELIKFRENICPIIYYYNIDIVLHGHSHNYERSYFISNFSGISTSWNASYISQAGIGYPTAYDKTTYSGTVFVVIGNGGQGGSLTTSGTWPHNAMISYDRTTFASLIIDFNVGVGNDEIDVQVIPYNYTSSLLDRFKIKK